MKANIYTIKTIVVYMDSIRLKKQRYDKQIDIKLIEDV